MTPTEQAEILARRCANEISWVDLHMVNAIGPDNKTIAHQIIDKHCCLVEFFEVVEWSNNLVNNCATELDAKCCEQNTRNALTALRAKLPKGIEL